MLLGACTPTDDITLEVLDSGYNTEPVLDRSGSIGKLGDGRFGPYFDGVRNYRDAPAESSALLQPELADHRQEALLKSDCYWTPYVGETLSFTWEQTLTLKREPAHLTCASPDTVGTCRLTNPDNGEALETIVSEAPDVSSCPQNQPTMMTISGSSAQIPTLPFAVSESGLDDPFRIELASDLGIYQATFKRRTLPANADDKYGLCNAPGGFSAPSVTASLDSNYCQRPDSRLSPTCVTACKLIEPDDALYSVSIPGVSPDLDLLPAIRTVPASGRKIARPMTPVANAPGTYRWSTTAEGPECHVVVEGPIPPPSKPYYHCRWHENFSPSVQVLEVRLFVLTDTGTEVTLTPQEPLVIRTFDPPDDDEELWHCDFNDVGMIHNLRDRCTAMTRGATVPLLATPTYWLGAFETATAQNNRMGAVPLTAPLQWSVDLSSSMIPAGDVYIEFSLIAVTGQALMSVDGLRNVGSKRVGQSVSGSILLTNIGSEVARVDSLRFMGPDQDDFRYRVLEERLPPLNVPVEISEQPDGGVEIEIASSMQGYMPLLEASSGAFHNYLQLRSPTDIAWATAIEDGLVTAPPAATRRFRPAASETFISTVDPRLRHSPVVSRTGEHLQATRSLPFTVQPGENVEIFVDMTPSAYGERWTMLRIEGVDAARPDRHWWVASVVLGFGLYGPDLELFPYGVLELPYDLSPDPTERNVLLINNGDIAARRRNFAITGRDADRFRIISQHAAERDILPGTDELFRLKLRNPCALTAFSPAQPASIPEWHASLEIDTDEGQLSAELLGRPMDCTWRRDRIYNRPRSRQPMQPGAE